MRKLNRLTTTSTTCTTQSVLAALGFTVQVQDVAADDHSTPSFSLDFLLLRPDNSDVRPNTRGGDPIRRGGDAT